MATTVTAKGTNWYRPSLHICFTSDGLASLTPVTSRIAARQDSGIRFSHAGRSATLTSSSTPWTIAASFVLPPALMFTELRTITDVIGSPPISPAATFPIPWASSSRLGGRGPLLRVELVDRLQVQQRLQRGHGGDRHGGGVHRRVRPLREVGRLQKPEEPGQAVRHRHLHQVARLDDPRPAELPEQQAEPDAQQHHDQRGGDERLLQRLPPVPDDQHRDRHEADRGRAGVDVPDRSDQFGERVLVVRLLEGHLPFRVGVVAEDVGDLLQDQDHADGGQQALDHAGREEGREEPGPGESQADLDQPREDHGQQERLERPERQRSGRPRPPSARRPGR